MLSVWAAGRLEVLTVSILLATGCIGELVEPADPNPPHFSHIITVNVGERDRQDLAAVLGVEDFIGTGNYEGDASYLAKPQQTGLFFSRTDKQNRVDPPYCVKQEFRIIVRVTDEVLASLPAGTCLADHGRTQLTA